MPLPGLYPVEQIARAAEQFIGMIEPATRHVALCGSYRRGLTRSEGVVVVAVPLIACMTDMFAVREFPPIAWRDELDAAIRRMVASGRIRRETGANPSYQWNARRKQGLFVADNGEAITLDISIARAENYGLLQALRTGPEHYSKALVTPTSKGGLLPTAFEYKKDVLRWRVGQEVLDVFDEYALGRVIGKPLPPPEKRR